MIKLCKEDIDCYHLASSEVKSNKEFILFILNHRNKSSIDEALIIDNIKYNLLNDLEFNHQLIDKLSFANIKSNFGKKIVTDKLNYLYLFRNNDNINKDKNLITKLIYKTPRTFKYIDKSLIDIPLVEYLLDNFKYKDNNPYYTNFYSDIRFNNYYIHNKYSPNNKLISSNSRIVNVISNYIELTKRPNANVYIGLCPFHDDHNPSLSVYPDTGVFICHTCRTSGNTNKFIKLYENETTEYIRYNKLGIFKKNRFYYYLYANLPTEIKNNIDIIKKFLSIDGCILKLVPKELRYNSSLVETAMNQDISSFRYIMNNQTYKDKYINLYPILNYYLPKEEKSKEYLDSIEFIRQKNSKRKKHYKDPFASFGETIEITDDDLPF